MKKNIKRIIILTIILSLVFTVGYASAKNEQAYSSTPTTFSIGDGVIEVSENDSLRLVKYIEDGKIVNEATLIKETGNIYFNDNPSTLSIKREVNKIDISAISYTKIYNVSDFVVETKPIKPEVLPATRSSWNQVYSYSFYDDENEYNSGYIFRSLYTDEYTRSTWHYIAGITLAIIVAVLTSYLTTAVITTFVTNAVGISGGAILSALTVKRVFRDYLAEYKVIQGDPEVFVGYSAPYPYRTDERFEFNNLDTYWEINSQTPYYNSSSFWYTLSRNVAYYFIY